MAETEDISPKVKRINKIFSYLHQNKMKTFKSKLHDEEFYYADIEGTRSQFTKKQLGFIQKKYDIPISTKITYAIVEQMISFLTGGKPSIELMAQEELHRDWVMINKRLIDSIWYENNVANEMTQATRDSVVTGSGYIRVRKNNFYKESTFGVVVENIPWMWVYVDPASYMPEFQDADYVCIARTMPKGKAEREYGIKIKSDSTNQLMSPGFEDNITYDTAESGLSSIESLDSNKHEFKPVWIKEFYEKKMMTVYITPEGYMSLEEPQPILIPNPDKIQLMQQIQELGAMKEQLTSTAEPAGTIVDDTGEDLDMKQQSDQIQQLNSQLEYMANEYEKMPSTVTAYLLLLENDESVTVMEFSEIKQKRLESTILVGDHIYAEDIEPTDEHIIHHLAFTHNRNPNNTYGATHFIKDANDAMNKLWGLLIYDMQMRTSLRVIYPDQALQDPVQAESKFSLPGAFLSYKADAELPNGGRPEVMEIPPSNTYLVQAIQMLQSMAEYITGIFGVVQGNPEAAPSTMGATHSLQSYGTQRIKLASRSYENTLSLLGYNIIKYLQRYCPKEKLLQLVDPEMDPNIIYQSGDTKYKVRVSVAQSLPTSRQIAANALSSLAGQTQSPGVQELLMQYMLKFMDIKEADEISQAMDVVKKYESQLEQQGQQLSDMESQMKAAQNNIMQKDLALEREKGMADIKIETEKQKLDIQNSDIEEEIPELTK